MAFTPIYNAFERKPKSQYLQNPITGQLSMLRDNFSIPTWLMLGAALQATLTLLPYRNILLAAPVFLYLSYHLTRTVLQTLNILPNPYMHNVIPGRTSAVYPSTADSSVQDTPADRQVCAIILAVRSNHPLGMFAPGFKEVGDYFTSMGAELDADPIAHGFLGNSSWLAAGDRGTSSEFMSIVYFDSPESLHKYAHGPLHTKTMEWWNKTERAHGHIGIMHEVFAAPRKSWEAIYLNYHPTGLGATYVPVTQGEVEGKGKETRWVNPLVKVKGPLRYSKGRMGRPFDEKKEWVAFENVRSDED